MITLILGPMFSGKTTELIRFLVRSQIAGKKVLLVRPTSDTRGFLTHDHKSHQLEEVFVEHLSDIENIFDYNVIGVDEGQFFNGSFVHDANHLANQGKEVIISMLNATSEAKPFDNVQGLIPLAENIIRINAICTKCGSEYGSFSYYKLGRKTDKVKVGGSSDYTSLCRDCYNVMMS